jgi:acyl-CoA thioester hydrolase
MGREQVASPILRAEIALDIPFHDLDPMGVVWHGRYAKYLEQARCDLLRLFDYDYPAMRESGYAWPVVELNLKYIRPLRYGQRVSVRADLLEWENRLKIGYLIADAASGERLTRATTIQVAIDIATGELQFVSPQALIDRLHRCSGGRF